MIQWILILLGCCILGAAVFHHLRFLGNVVPGAEGLITMERLYKVAKTGDLMLFSGTGRDSAVVKAWSGNVWSHIGMVIVDPESGRLYLYNADACSSRRNCLDGTYKEGVQMNDLEVYIKTYPGYSVFCPIVRLDGDVKKPRLAAIKPMIRALNGRPFNHDWMELLRSTQGRGGGYAGSRAESVDEYFCSQLVAESLYYMGVLGNSIPFNEYHPASFIGELESDWMNGYSAGERLIVVQ